MNNYFNKSKIFTVSFMAMSLMSSVQKGHASLNDDSNDNDNNIAIPSNHTLIKQSKDVLGEIFSHLDPKSLAAIAQTSKRFSEVVGGSDFQRNYCSLTQEACFDIIQTSLPALLGEECAEVIQNVDVATLKQTHRLESMSHKLGASNDKKKSNPLPHRI